MKTRRKARIVALQALYEVDCSAHPLDQVLAQRLEDRPLPPAEAEFARRLTNGVRQHAARLDKLIHQHAPEWPIEQMAIIELNILRLALWEFAVNKETPVKVAINEAVELAKEFGSDSAPRFVNGVLGALASQAELRV